MNRISVIKRMKKRIFAGILLVVVLLFGGLWLTGCKRQEKEPELTRYTATFLEIFDTRTEIVGYGKSEEEFKAQAEQIKEKLQEYHQLFDIYNSYDGINNIKTINDNAGKEPVVVDQEIIALLKMSKDMYGRTEGQVNVAMGSVLSIWHNYREEGRDDPENARLPKQEELEKAALHTDISQIIIDEEKSTVFLADAQMSLDVGGIGKGYAVQKAAEYAKETGMESGLISVGGNVCAIGTKLDGSMWKIGIQNPNLESEDTYADKVEAMDGCIVTSGDYQRYYTVDGVKYCHIIDPDTLMPADYFASVTILSKDSGMADTMSTAVYNMPFDEGLDFVNGTSGVEAMWILKDGTIHYSEHFKTFFMEE